MLRIVVAFQKLPMVTCSNYILCIAKRKARRTGPTMGITNIAKRENNKGAKQLDALMKESPVPLRGNQEKLPKSVVLHPYERSLVEPTLGEGNYEEKNLSRLPRTVGAFQQLPRVMNSTDILCSAKRKARRIGPTKGITNVAKREKNKGAKQLDALMKELAVPLRGYLENFPKRHVLHPYERSLVELTLGDGNYEEVLGRVDSLRKKILSVGKQQAALCAQSSSMREAEVRLNEGVKKLEELFLSKNQAIEDLLNIAKTLRAMPVVDPGTPTLCLVGAPNVGKSSIVRILSTGKPEVCDYPFTTRGILMGHIVLNCEHFQVTDTPGLLKRHDDERNNLEKLTLAVLSHLPTAILYIHDISGQCGTSVSDQFDIYKEMKERFKDHLWLDVVSKCDLLEQSHCTVKEDEELQRYKRYGPDEAIHVSVKCKIGIVELKDRVHELLIWQMTRK